MSNDSKDPMVYMVVKSHANTLAGYDVSDGYRVKGEKNRKIIKIEVLNIAIATLHHLSSAMT